MMTGSRRRNKARPDRAQNQAIFRLNMISHIISKYSWDRGVELSEYAGLKYSGRISGDIVSGNIQKWVTPGYFFGPADTAIFKLIDGVSPRGSEASRL